MNSRSRGSLPLLAALLTGTLVSSCVPARQGAPMLGTLEGLSAQEERGMLVFDRNCQPCHPGGWAGLGPSLNDKPLPSFLIRLQVRVGLGAMPAFGPDRLSDAELNDLLAYVVRLRSSALPAAR